MNRRSEYLDFCKGILIILVVAGHMIQVGSGASYVQHESFYDNIIYKIIYSFHMPFFMAISGFLYYFTTTKYSGYCIFLKKIKSIFVPIVSWSIVCSLIKYAQNLTSVNYIKVFFVDFLLNNWFLWAILYLSLAVYLLERLAKYLNISDLYIYIFSVILTFFTPTILNFYMYSYLLPFFWGAFLINKYGIISKLINNDSLKTMGVCSFIIYVTLFMFWNRDAYIYTSHLSIFTKNGILLHQLYVDIYRYLVGFFGTTLFSIIFYYLCKRFRYVIVVELGKQTIGIYIISCILNLFIETLFCSFVHTFNLVWLILETVMVLFVSYYFTILIDKNNITRSLFLGR